LVSAPSLDYLGDLVSNSDKIGGVAFLWDWAPIWAGLFLLVIDFVFVNALMYFPERRFHRPRWKSFAFGDSICLPLYGACAVYALRDMTPGHTFYQQAWWHWMLFLFFCAASILIEVMQVKAGVYTMRQELSPAKLWHTAIFPVMAYFVASSGIPLLLEHPRSWGFLGCLVAIAGFVATLVWDQAWAKKNPELARATH
jgi:hypothetical protein